MRSCWQYQSNLLKKSTTCTASQSLKSSPFGSLTTLGKLIIGSIGFADRNFLFGCRRDLSEVDARVKAGLSLFVQRVLHRARLELLLRPESLLLVEHLAELAQIHFDHTTHSLMPSGNF